MRALRSPTPCPECGASLSAESHECENERRLDFQLYQLRADVARLLPELQMWLETPQARFAAWLAERERLTASKSKRGE